MPEDNVVDLSPKEIGRIFESEGLNNKELQDKLLPDIHGFELLMGNGTAGYFLTRGKAEKYIEHMEGVVGRKLLEFSPNIWRDVKNKLGNYTLAPRIFHISRYA